MSVWSLSHRWYLFPACQLAALCVLSTVLFGFRLGREGLSYTEGHRVIPAWEMLETGDFWTPRMFGTVYLRKPPGISWAIAASSALFGTTEFAARLTGAVSGAAMVVATWWFATRWFGSPWGFFAALAQAATPQYWRFARTAEIEGLHNALTQWTVFLTIDLLLEQPQRTRLRVVRAVSALGLALTAMSLTKGPAGIPCFLGAILAVLIVRGNGRPGASKRLWAAIGLATFGIFAVLATVARQVHAVQEETPVMQRVFGFDWAVDHFWGVVLLGPTALFLALPTSLLILAPSRRRDVRIPRASDQIAQTIAWASILSLAIYSAVGLRNPRYAMPATTFLPALAGYAGPRIAGWLACQRDRSRWRRVLLSPMTFAATMLVAWLGLVFVVEPRSGNTSGRQCAKDLVEQLPDNAVIWADGLIEARPETLEYTRLLGRERGRRFNVFWRKWEINHAEWPPPGVFLALRTDNGEFDLFRQAKPSRVWKPVFMGDVHRYQFVVVQVKASAVATTRNPGSASPPSSNGPPLVK